MSESHETEQEKYYRRKNQEAATEQQYHSDPNFRKAVHKNATGAFVKFLLWVGLGILVLTLIIAGLASLSSR